MVTVALIVSGCGGGGSSGSADASGLVEVQFVPLSNIRGINGRDDIFGAVYTSTGAGYPKSLQIYQQDPLNPDQLLDFGSVYLGIDSLYTSIRDVTFTQDWATVVINGAGVLGSGDGYVGLVSLQNHPNYSLDTLITIDSVLLDRAIAMDDWLVLTAGAALEILDISAVSSPVSAGSFNAVGAITSVVPVPNGFYAFTTTGYVHIDYSSPANVTFTEVSSLDLRQIGKAFLDGNKVFFSGPSIIAGKTQIGRIDVSAPSSPALDFAKNDIDGEFVDFCVDDTTNKYHVMTNGLLFRYSEVGGIFTLDWATNSPYAIEVSDHSQLYVLNGRIYTLTMYYGMDVSTFQ